MIALVAAVLSSSASGFTGVQIKHHVGRSFAPRQAASSLKMSAAVSTDKMAALATAANEARGLAMDSIAAAHSGHMGLPLGCAEVGAVLYGSEVCDIDCLSSTASIFMTCYVYPIFSGQNDVLCGTLYAPVPGS